MGKFEFAVILIFVLGQNVFCEDFYSIELEGKFSQDSGPYISETLMAAKAELRAPNREERDVEPRLLPPITFTGTVTLKTPRYVAIVGVNSSFEFTQFWVDPEENVENVDNNRVKRDSEQKETARLGFYGQFQIGKRSSEVLRVKLYVDITRQSHDYTPPTSDSSEMDDVNHKMEFGFKGKLTGISRNGKEESALFGVSLGVQDKTVRDHSEENESTNRLKRQSDQQQTDEQEQRQSDQQKPVVKIDGEFTLEEVMGHGGRMVTVDKVTGEISFDTTIPTENSSPKDLFYANDGTPSFQYYFETAGNVTGSVAGKPVFVEPLTVSFRNTVEEELRRKRDTKKPESLELEYDGYLSGVSRTNPSDRDRFGILAKLKLWEISTIYHPRKYDYV